MTARRNAVEDSGGEKFAPRRIFLTFKSTRILYDPRKREVTERAFYLVRSPWLSAHSTEAARPPSSGPRPPSPPKKREEKGLD